jgi:hypothetical protein
MERFSVRSAAHGMVGGLIAGAVVAAWFLATDIATGQAFQTPARLASIVLHTPFTGPWPRAVLAYTLIHFGVFACLGLAALWVLTLLDVEPGLFVGVAFGLGVLNAVHYGGVLVNSASLLTVVPVAQVVVANLLGGMAMMAYLHRALAVKSPFGWNALRRYPTVFEGVSTGLVGAAAVAFWFLLVDLARGGPFLTPAVLGSALLLGGSGPATVVVSPGVITAYTFLHVAVFVVLGLVFAQVVRGERPRPIFWMRVIVIFGLVEALFYGTMLLLSAWVVAEMGWLVILVANVLAAVTMGLWLLRTRAQHRAAPAVPSR